VKKFLFKKRGYKKEVEGMTASWNAQKKCKKLDTFFAEEEEEEVKE
jgi:hypothetical protein